MSVRSLGPAGLAALVGIALVSAGAATAPAGVRPAGAAGAAGEATATGSMTPTQVAAATSWHTTSAPAHTGGQLDDVSCAGTFCAAVGRYSVGSGGNASAVAEAYIRTQGRWSASPVPYASNRLLTAVSCSSATFCMALGDDILNARPTAYRWNGRTWTLVAIPQVGAGTTIDISCTSPSFCLGVGRVGSPSDHHSAEIWRWNGSRWSVITAPKSSASVDLNGVSCRATTFCMAAGSWSGSSGTHPFVARFNGTSWSTATPPVVPYPDKTRNYNYVELKGISCATTTDCAVGGSEQRVDFSGGATPIVSLAHPYLAQLRAGRWFQVAAPTDPQHPAGEYSGVSCTAASVCSATGTLRAALSNDGPARPLAAFTSGSSWVRQATPALGATQAMIAATSCATGGCVAVGQWYVGAGSTHEYTMAR